MSARVSQLASSTVRVGRIPLPESGHHWRHVTITSSFENFSQLTDASLELCRYGRVELDIHELFGLQQNASSVAALSPRTYALAKVWHIQAPTAKSPSTGRMSLSPSPRKCLSCQSSTSSQSFPTTDVDSRRLNTRPIGIP
jgi:hypothetical protein